MWIYKEKVPLIVDCAINVNGTFAEPLNPPVNPPEVPPFIEAVITSNLVSVNKFWSNIAK